MGRREVVDLEAKLFDVDKKGCLAVMIGPRKRGEIDHELHQDGSARMKIGLKDAPVPTGTSRYCFGFGGRPPGPIRGTRRGSFGRGPCRRRS